MLRISTTTLDSFRKLINTKFESDEIENQRTEEFILQLQKKETENKYMEYGKAFHEIMENPTLYYNELKDNYICNDIEFEKDCIIKSYFQIHKNITKELLTNEHKVTKIYTINNYDVELVAKADMLYGNTTIENKTVWSIYNGNGARVFYDEFINSLQWKIYLEIFETDKCKYNVFYLSDKNKTIDLLESYSFEFDKSQYDKNEIETSLTEFIKWLENKDLIKLLTKGE